MNTSPPGLYVTCDRCWEPLKEPGALVFGPPMANGTVMKIHVCVGCWPLLFQWTQEILETGS